VINSRRKRGVSHVTCIGEQRSACRVFAGKPEGKRLLEWPRQRWEDNIKMDIKEIG
jgi:hypothetical protein